MRLLFLTAAALALPAAAAPAQAQRDRDRDRDSDRERGSALDTTLAIGRNGAVELTLHSGEIVVTAWDRQEVRIRARSDRGEIDLDASSSRISLDVDGHGYSGESRFEVQVPAGTRVLARAMSGDVSVRGTRAEVEARTLSGDVDVQDAATLLAESVSGGVRATRIAGSTGASSVSGDIELSDVGGDVRAESTSGEIWLTNIRARVVRAESVSGTIDFSGTIDRAGRYEFTSHSGDINLALPADVGAQVGVETFNGDIQSDFPLRMEPTTDDRNRQRRLEFTLGSGGARITASTFSGSIDLERGTRRAANDKE
jgi:DUF4097 and DUF4098 domain-containing protein YvlB